MHALGVALTTIALVASARPSPRGPDDPPVPVHQRARQWALAPLGAPDVWRTTRGEGVVVAVLDTGVDPRHPDLTGAVIEGPDLTGTARRKSLWGRHGTAMASLIAGRGRGGDRFSGVRGIAPGAMVLSVRVALENDDPRRDQARRRGGNALARGIRYAVDHGAQVISMSLGCGNGVWEGSAAEQRAVRYALGRGVVLVASSGNDGTGPGRKNFPAAYPGVISVGAVDEAMRVAPFSNRQANLSVVAPGTRIVTAGQSGTYVVANGTSSAAALVAGVAALVRSEFPRLSPAQVRRAIERGATRPPAGGHDPAYGHGVVNAARALEQAAEAGQQPLRARALPHDTPTGDPTAGTAPAAASGSALAGRDTRTDARRLVCAVLILFALALAARRLLERRRTYLPPAGGPDAPGGTPPARGDAT
ncbi:S8 family serine peptidase [Planomonospora sp. ID67723]|uniref:S8 family peptidase n=1 Tax=Planomonospora sp. ID67723 TaxID=2738134 RepID=UPI001E42C8A2|nr:S8 family serine peptidase [Planomonospora sp. ID67723]